jgi:hypothetical protein
MLIPKFKTARDVYDWTMRQYNIPQPNLINSVRAKNLSIPTAISELGDNARRFQATKIEIEFGQHAIIGRDNGIGTADPSLLLGYTRTTAQDGQTDISRYGIGSKDCQMHFGTKALVQTVHEGVYREQSIDWREVEKRGWPERDANLKTLPWMRAPKFIRGGGLILTISDLDKRYRYAGWFDNVCKEMSLRYRLAIEEEGLQLTLIDSKDKRSKTLTSDLAALGIYGFQKTMMGTAGGRNFELKYTDLKEYNANLGGVNIYYDGRRIKRLLSLNKHAVPQSLFAQVKLSPAWRTELTGNKEDILTPALMELSEALYPMLKEMMELIRGTEDDIAITEVDFAIRGMLDNVIVLDLSKKGQFKGSAKIAVNEHGPDPGPGPGPGPGPNPIERMGAQDGGNNASRMIPQTKLGIRVLPDDKPTQHIAYRWVLDNPDGIWTMKIFVNRRDFPLIASAYVAPYKLNVLMPLAAAAFSEWAAEEIKQSPDGGMLSALINSLNTQGAGISTDLNLDDFKRWSDFRYRIGAFILSRYQLTKAEQQKLATVTDTSEGAIAI